MIVRSFSDDLPNLKIVREKSLYDANMDESEKKEAANSAPVGRNKYRNYLNFSKTNAYLKDLQRKHHLSMLHFATAKENPADKVRAAMKSDFKPMSEYSPWG